MLHNTGPYGPNEVPVNHPNPANMSSLGGHINMSHNINNLSKNGQQSVQTASGHYNLPEYTGYSHPPLNMSPQISHIPTYPHIGLQHFMPQNSTSANDMSWQNGMLPMNLNAQQDHNVNIMNYHSNYDKRLLDTVHDDFKETSGRKVPLNIPQIPIKTTLKHINPDNYAYNDNYKYSNHNLDLSPRPQEKIQLDNTRRKNIENTVRLIENILINSSKNKDEGNNYNISDKVQPSSQSLSVYSTKAESTLQTSHIYGSKDESTSETPNIYSKIGSMSGLNIFNNKFGSEPHTSNIYGKTTTASSETSNIFNSTIGPTSRTNTFNLALGSAPQTSNTYSSKAITTSETPNIYSTKIGSSSESSNFNTKLGSAPQTSHSYSSKAITTSEAQNIYSTKIGSTSESSNFNTKLGSAPQTSHSYSSKAITTSEAQNIYSTKIRSTSESSNFNTKLGSGSQTSHTYSSKAITTSETPNIYSTKTGSTSESSNLNTRIGSSSKAITTSESPNIYSTKIGSTPASSNFKTKLGSAPQPSNTYGGKPIPTSETSNVFTKSTLNVNPNNMKEIPESVITKYNSSSISSTINVTTNSVTNSINTATTVLRSLNASKAIDDNNKTDQSENNDEDETSDEESDSENNEKPTVVKAEVEVDHKEIVIESKIEIKVENTSCVDIDYFQPFLRDCNGAQRDEVDSKIVDGETSVEEALAAIKNEVTLQGYYECPHCTLLFKNAKRFLVHTKWHTFGLTYEKRMEVAKQREQRKQQKREAKVIERMNAKEVTDVTAAGKVFACKDCDKVFSAKSSLKNHRKRTHPTRSRDCKICRKTVIGWSAMRAHVATHSCGNSGGYQCVECPKRFKYSHSLAKHKDTHLEKTHGCTECPKMFGSQALLKMHMKTHERAQRGTTYRCTYCGKGFYECYSLQVHERTHRNERPFNCEICNTSFGTNSSLKRHMKVSHSTSKPHECSICHRSFSTERIRDRHEVRVHSQPEDFKFPCKLCSCKYLKLKDLQKHVYKVHPKNKRRKKVQSDSE